MPPSTPSTINPGQLEPVGYDKRFFVITYDPNFTPDPLNPNSRPVKRIDLENIASTIVPWNMQTQEQPAILHDVTMNHVTPALRVTDNMIVVANNVHLTQLGKDPLLPEQRYFAVAALYEPDTPDNKVRITFGSLQLGLNYAHLSFEPDIGLVWGNVDTSDYTQIIDRRYQLGTYFAIFIDTFTQTVTVITQSNLVTGLKPLVNQSISQIGIFHSIGNPATLTTQGLTYLSSDYSVINGVLTIPSEYDIYRPITTYGDAAIPESAKVGDYLRTLNRGRFMGVEYLADEYAMVLSTIPPIVFPIDDSLRHIQDRRQIKIPRDYPNLNAAIEHYSHFTFGPGGYLDIIFELGYVLSDVDQIVIDDDYRWLSIRSDFDVITPVVNFETLITISAGGRMGSISGDFVYAGISKRPRFLQLSGQLDATGIETVDGNTRLKVIDYPLGAFFLNPSQVGDYVRIEESVSQVFDYNQNEGSILINFSPRLGFYRTNKKTINVYGKNKVQTVSDNHLPVNVIVQVSPDLPTSYEVSTDITASGLVNYGYGLNSGSIGRHHIRIASGLSTQGFTQGAKLFQALDVRGYQAFVSLEAIIPPNDPSSLLNITATECKVVGGFRPSVNLSRYNPSTVVVVGRSVRVDMRSFEPSYNVVANRRWFGRIGVGTIPMNAIQPDGTLCLRDIAP